MSLLTFPLGLDEVSVVQSIGEYIMKKVPERWINEEGDKDIDVKDEGEKSIHNILLRWR
jgi:hypothetical protein